MKSIIRNLDGLDGLSKISEIIVRESLIRFLIVTLEKIGRKFTSEQEFVDKSNTYCDTVIFVWLYFLFASLL